LIAKLEAERDHLAQRCITIADEQFGPNPVQSAEDALTQIERRCFELRQERDRYREALLAASPHVFRQQHRGAHEQDRDDAKAWVARYGGLILRLRDGGE
jgi:hypothetical protein